MPLIIITLIIGAVTGLFAPRSVALAVTGAAGALTVFAHVWAVADGQGNDPWWLVVTALVGSGVAFALAYGLSGARAARRAA